MERKQQVTKDEFIRRAIAKYGDKYNYSEIIYECMRKPVTGIKCDKHHIFSVVSATKHVNGDAVCKDCSKTAKNTTERYVAQCREMYDEFFDYSETAYSGAKTKISVKCRKCNQNFMVRPDHHKSLGHGCSKLCRNRILRARDFVANAQKVHSGLYTYEHIEEDYVDQEDKVRIHCTACGIVFEQIPINHLAGSGCQECAKQNARLTQEEFMAIATQKHGNAYDYSLAVYTRACDKITIICNTCDHQFEQNANSHLSRGSGCPRCARNQTLTRDEFIKRCTDIHQGLYKYDHVNYVNYDTKVTIYCTICKDTYEQTPDKHLIGQGCSKHRFKTEVKFRDFLTKQGFSIEEQVQFPDLTHRRPLRFDFRVHVGDIPVLIEIDGPQHFRQIVNWAEVEHNKTRDELKNKYCTEKNLHLIRIYQEDVLFNKNGWVAQFKQTLKDIREGIAEVHHFISPIYQTPVEDAE